MSRARAYLDHNATSPIRPEVLDGMAEVLRAGGNPSSVHGEGRAARARVERAREQVAALVGADSGSVVFTSGGTEANATGLRPGALAASDGRPIRRLVTGATEHTSVLDGHGFGSGDVATLRVAESGRIDRGTIDEAFRQRDDGAILLSVALANSETGIVQDLAPIGRAARAAGALLHTDAVQAAGRLRLDMGELGIDALTLSAHKLGGPPGVGALVVSPDRQGPAFRLIGGGGQERRRRGGTENVAGIVGFGIAAEIAARRIDAEAARLGALRERAEREIRRIAPDACIFGLDVARLPNTVSFAVPGLAAETALIALDLDGVAGSSGSACSSGKVGRSHVLAAMGVPAGLAAGAMRLSFGWNSSQEDVSAFARAFEKVVQRLYERGRVRAAA